MEERSSELRQPTGELATLLPLPFPQLFHQERCDMVEDLVEAARHFGDGRGVRPTREPAHGPSEFLKDGQVQGSQLCQNLALVIALISPQLGQGAEGLDALGGHFLVRLPEPVGNIRQELWNVIPHRIGRQEAGGANLQALTQRVDPVVDERNGAVLDLVGHEPRQSVGFGIRPELQRSGR